MKAAGYLRVSTSEQNTDMQRLEILEYCKRQGWPEPQFFEDQGISGGHTNRPAFQKMMAEVRRKKLSHVVVFKLDRIGRKVADLVLTLQEMDACGVRFVSLHDAIDMGTPAGRFMSHILASVAELERENIRERVRAGIAAAKAKGKRLGPKVSVHVDLERVRELLGRGLSQRAVAKELGLTLSTLQRAMARPAASE